MFFKIGVLKNFAIFTGKHLGWCLFLIKSRPSGLQLYWKKSPIQMFSVNIVKFLRTAYFREHLWWLLLWLLEIPDFHWINYLQLAYTCHLSLSIPHVNLWFSDVFRGYRRRLVTWNGLSSKIWIWSNLWFNSFMTEALVI